MAINNDSFEAHVKLADLLATAGRLRDALPHLRRIVLLRPNSADTHSDLGGALLVLGQRDEAAQQIRRALELDPNHAGAKQNLALLNREDMSRKNTSSSATPREIHAGLLIDGSAERSRTARWPLRLGLT